MNFDGWEVVDNFEAALCQYTGAPHAVALNSGTAALLLSLMWCRDRPGRYITSGYVSVPKRTYFSVPASVVRAGLKIKWDDRLWRGQYCLYPLPVYDAARRFRADMYKGGFQCVSFAANKILSAEQGGAILHDNDAADLWFRMMRYDGRTPGVAAHWDKITLIGHHCPMIPSVAAQLLLKLARLPASNEDLPDYPYPNLSRQPAFKPYTVEE